VKERESEEGIKEPDLTTQPTLPQVTIDDICGLKYPVETHFCT